MRTLLLVLGLYLAHRVLLALVLAYAEHMQRLDRQLTWVSIILVVYMVVNVLLQWLHYIR